MFLTVFNHFKHYLLLFIQIWVTYPERPVQLDRNLVSRKLNSVYRPIFALISQALQNTENIALVMYTTLFVY